MRDDWEFDDNEQEIMEDLEQAENRVSRPAGKRFHKRRWLCDVLQEMRDLIEANLNSTYTHPSLQTVMILIEEVQTMANRMETALEHKRNMKEWEDEAKKIAEKVDKMQQEAYDMGLELDRMKHNALELEE